MKRERRLFLLGSISASMLVALAVTALAPGLLRDPAPPEDFDALLHRVTRHPADWRAVSMASDAALDSDKPRRRELWNATFDLATRLAPTRRNPPAGFVRAGLFHWYELQPAERQKVVRVVSPLMRDPQFFSRMYQPFWTLTRDLAWLQRVAPDTLNARASLREVAIRYGEFGEYRSLRESLRRKRLELAGNVPLDAPVEDLLALIPERVDGGDEPLVRRILQELDRRPFNPERVGGNIAPLLEYAVEHDLQPMAGIRPLIESPGKIGDVTRARAALDLGDPSLATRIEISSAVVGDPRWTPYYVERARREAAEGNAAEADGYLTRAAAATLDLRVLDAAVDVASRLGRREEAERNRRQLGEAARAPRQWTDTCGQGQLCAVARTHLRVARPGETIVLPLETLQSDEIPPYVEIFVSDQLAAEGEVGERREFVLQVPEAGVHRIEVRLVNRLTGNGTQRRVRLS